MSEFAPINTIKPAPSGQGTEASVNGKPWTPPGVINWEALGAPAPRVSGAEGDCYVTTHLVDLSEMEVGGTQTLLVCAALGHELVDASIIFTDRKNGEAS